MFGGNQQNVREAWDAIIENLIQIRIKYPELNGLKYWEAIKIFLEEIDARNNTEITYNPEHRKIVTTFEKFLYHLPERDQEGNLIQKNHFLLQQLNLPYKDKGKVSFRRFMQIALNIGQFEDFNNTDHFSPEIIELIKENKLSDINTYMTPENYNKFIFEDADLIKLEGILNKLNINPPLKLEQVGGNKSRSYKIRYNNMSGGAAFAPAGAPVFPRIDIFRTKYGKTASYLYTRDPKGKFYFVLARKVPIGSRIRLNPKDRTGAAGTQDRYCGKWGSFGGAADNNATSTLDAAIIEISDEGGIHGLTSKTIDIEWAQRRNMSSPFRLELATEKNGVALLLFHVDFTTFQKLFPPFPNKRGGAEIVTSSHGEIDYVSAFTIQQLVNEQKKETNKGNNFMLSYAVDTFNELIFPHIANKSRTFSQREMLTRVPDITDRKVSPQPTYKEGPAKKYT